MKNSLLSLAAVALLLSAWPALAQTNDSPTMAPDSGAKSNNPFGMNIMGKERPKDAKTEITATKQATFDNAASVAEFEGRVVVKDPQFTLFCERLKVTLGKDRKGMQLVEAFENVVIVQENTESNGEKIKSIGRGGKVVYNPETGEVTLSIWPSVQHGINTQVGTDESTIMIMSRNGKSRTIGTSKTVITDTGAR